MCSALIIKGVIFRFVHAFFLKAVFCFFVCAFQCRASKLKFFLILRERGEKALAMAVRKLFYGSRTGVLSRGNEYLKKFCAFLKKCLTCVNIISIMIECIRMR